MYDSTHYLQEKLAHLAQKYPRRLRYCAFRMIFTSLAVLCHFPFKKFCKVPPVIVFAIKGGLGDFLIACNYIYYFYNYLSDTKIDIKIHYHNLNLLNAFCPNLPGVSAWGTDFNKMQGTLRVNLNRFPHILDGDFLSLTRKSQKFYRLFTAWNNFYMYNRKFFYLTLKIDSLANSYATLLGAKRINQADIGGLLNMGEDFMFPIPMSSAQESKIILSKFSLSPKKYITIQRGQGLIDQAKINNKLWDVVYYNELITLLRKQYPSLKMVQLGTSREGFNEDFEGVDVNLRGKTNLEELKVVLKYSSLHIDCEGGLVHLRHALKGGPSVVLFGPTSPEVYGYSENLNLRSHACLYPCEWITDDWLSRCARRTNKHICMKSLTPQFVFEKIKKFFAN